MDRQEFLEYVNKNKFLCTACYELKEQILVEGPEILDIYEGMICGKVSELLFYWEDIKKEEDKYVTHMNNGDWE